MKSNQFFIFLCLMVSLSPLHSYAQQEDKATRIMNLLPAVVDMPGIDPAIPENFVAMSPNGRPNINDWVYWGPKEVLEEYFKDPKSLKQPILQVKLSTETFQNGPDTFFGEEELAKMPGVKIKKLMWGNTYPVMPVNVELGEEKAFLAWMGLNSPNGYALMFGLTYPMEKGHPNEEDLSLWNRFLEETTILPPYEFFKAHGQDLQEGYTIVTLNGTEQKIVAEKRNRDGLLRIVAMPHKGDSKLSIKRVDQCLMGSEWKYGEPLAKVKGTLTAKNPNLYGTVVLDTTMSILIRPVDEFSIPDNELKTNPQVVVYEE